jgi:hypothetical protein
MMCVLLRASSTRLPASRSRRATRAATWRGAQAGREERAGEQSHIRGEPRACAYRSRTRRRQWARWSVLPQLAPAAPPAAEAWHLGPARNEAGSGAASALAPEPPAGA